MARTLDTRSAGTAADGTGGRLTRLYRRRFIRLSAIAAGLGLSTIAHLARSVTGRDGLPTSSLTLVGTTDPATYEITVAGETVSRGLRTGTDPEIFGSTIEGVIATGVKRYHFDGEIAHARISGDVQVYLDGKRVNPDAI